MSSRDSSNKMDEFIYPNNEGINFDSIVGMDDLKNSMRASMIEPLANPTLYEELGMEAGDKYLLFGPPGCGKSYFSRAIAGELHAKCYELKPSTTIGHYNAIALVAEVFNQARFSRPSVLVIDEVETLTRDREEIEMAHYMQDFLNEMLIQFDNTANDNSKILIMGTSNAPWHIDGAFMREGRFSKAILTPPPDLETRIKYIRRLATGDQLSDSVLEDLARQTKLFSYADILGVFKKARQNCVRDILAQGKKVTSVADVVLSEEQIRDGIQNQFSSVAKWFEKFESQASKMHASLVRPVQEYLKGSRLADG